MALSADDAFVFEKTKVMHHNVVGKGGYFRDPWGIQLPSFQNFQYFASRIKTTLDVSQVFQVSVRMQRVTVRIFSVLG
jgi:hypothetical protein